ncbi:MAG: alcohol dehydrogenase [Rubrivivax sp. SCN 71-131]|nr:MAG: alcohol dehydrogenase [Rubrivivax sp. SCN 71-131]
MTYTARAALVRQTCAPVVVETITVADPRRDEVTMRLQACGVCHSDLSVVTGTLPLPPPVVLGHEGVGEVIAVGEGVSEFAVGDTVLSSFVSMCGTCRWCSIGRPELCNLAARSVTTLPDGTVRTFDTAGAPLSIFSGCGVMAEFATLHVSNVVKIDASGVAPECCALVSCGVMTGWGAAVNTAKVEPGSTCVVFGAGGVGLNAIQGCAMSGAAMIVAVDTNDAKLVLARAFGATHVYAPTPGEDAARALRKLTGGGADYAFECVGVGSVLAQAYGCLRKAGTAVMVGVARADDQVSVRCSSLLFEEKTLTGSLYGGARPRVDFPRILGLYKAGKLKLDELVTRRYTIEEAPQAFDDLANGRNARGVIVF